jgi:oxygen-dependent protoporphyrinogen oxidase
MHVAVIGSGISGLTLAHTLGRVAPGRVRVTLLEREARIGGVIRTDRLDGYLCEWGPSGFLDRAPDTQALIDELGLRDRLSPSRDEARRRFIYRGGKLREVPSGLKSFLTGNLLSVRGRLRVALEPFPRAGSGDDESIHQFAARRLGVEIADVVVDAMTTGIYGSSSRDLSIRACFPQLWQMERDHGSVVRGMLRRKRSSSAPRTSSFGRLVSFDNGIESLVAALGRSLGDAVRLGTSVEALQPPAEPGRGPWTIRTSEPATLTADHVVVATNAHAASRLLAPVHAELASLLDAIRFVPMVVVCLGFDAAAADARFDGFGFLVPKGESARILGAMWESSIFEGRAPAGHSLVRLMLGGGRDPGVVALDDGEIVAVARQDLKDACGVTTPPAFVRVFRQRPGLPQYAVGHAARVARIDELAAQHRGLHLLGNSYHGVALNACITGARDLAKQLAAPPA